jgi:hypothetical protein
MEEILALSFSKLRNRKSEGECETQRPAMCDALRATQREGLWKLQDNPFGGDAANSYNDGPPAPGAKPMGLFYELESSSPAAALARGKSLLHTHRTFHLGGPESALDGIAKATLGVSLDELKSVFKK